MKKILVDEFKNFLENHTNPLIDNCTLLALLNDNIIAMEKLCYISENSTGSFLCIVKYKDNTQISPTIELFANTDEDAEEIIAAILQLQQNGEMSGEYGIASYKNDKILKNPAFNKYIISDIQYIQSYYADNERDYSVVAPSESLKILSDESEPCFGENFLNQSGNHIKIVIKDVIRNPEKSKVLYLSKENIVIGYIALGRHYNNMWDVNFIFIDERERAKGYAAYMCKYAANYLKTKDCTLFYSYPDNAASERTAVKSGLLPCVERYITTIKI